jgi:ubiquitin C-terminal hydrolase
MNIEPFIIENAGNSCYIDALLVGLLFTPSHIDNLLKKDLTNTNSIYLQEYIKINFVNNIRENKSIFHDTIEMIRQLCLHNGWRKNTTNDECMNQQDVNEFYTFLMQQFESGMIEIQRKTITEGLPDVSDNGPNEIIPFIPLSLSENQQSVSVKEMLNNWLYNNVLDMKRLVTNNQESIVKGLNTYKLANVPNIIALSINRFTNKNERITTDIIIQKKIFPSTDPLMFHSNEWVFHSAICHQGKSPKSGHYYSLLYSHDRWYIFDDQLIPSLVEVSMADKNVTDIIKQECVFLLYRLI